MDELSSLVALYHEKKHISDSVFFKKTSHNKIIQSIIYLENRNKKKAFEYLRQSLKYNMFGFFFIKISIIILLLSPLFINKFIFSKLIKRG